MLAQNGTTLIMALAMSGASFALSVPALTVMVAANYHGRQHAQATGFLASPIPLAQVISLLIAVAFASAIGWHSLFALVAMLGTVNILLSSRLKVVPRPHRRIDSRF